MSYNVTINKGLQLNDFNLSDEKIAQIDKFLSVLEAWNEKINLTAHRTVDDLIYKDIIDTLYLSQHVQTSLDHPSSCIDMGCGAGFCGIVLAIANPDLAVGFMDSNRKKINFVRQACRELNIKKVEFINCRAEAIPPEWKGRFQCAVSRATWSLEDYLSLGKYYVQNNGMVFLMIGKKQKISPPEAKSLQGLEVGQEFIYTIKPKNYDRKILSFNKI